MFLFITGGSASGKSEYAEGRALAFGRERMIYLAAMMPFGEDARKRIERHRRLRAEKGFETVERYRDVEGLCCGTDEEARQFGKRADGAVVLLECLSNLTANEMFSREISDADDVAARILKGIHALRGLATDLIVVSIDVFGDGRQYDRETESYKQCLGRLNQSLADIADEVAEVVYGIPVIHKKNDKIFHEEKNKCSL